MLELEAARLAAVAACLQMKSMLYWINIDWERKDFKNYDRDVDDVLKFIKV